MCPVDKAVAVQRLQHFAKAGYAAAIGQLSKSYLLTLDIVEENMETIAWDFRMLSHNPNVTPAFVRAHAGKGWDWKRLSWHGGDFLTAPDLCGGAFAPDRIDAAQISNEHVLLELDMDVVLRHPELGWDWHAMTLRNNVSVDFMLAHRQLPWNWESISTKFAPDQSPSLTLSHVVENPWLPWRWEIISFRHDVVTLDTVLQHPHLPWSWSGVSCNSNVTEDIVSARPDLPWDYACLARNTSISFEFILQHADKPWDVAYVSQRKGMDFERTWQQFPWMWNLVSSNPHVRLEFVMAQPALPWHWVSLSINHAIPIDGMLRHRELPWVWSIASMRSDLADQVVGSNMDLPWSWALLTDNDCISCDFVAMHPDRPWQWRYMFLKKRMSYSFYDRFKDLLPPVESVACYSARTFLRASASARVAYARRHMAAWRIQRAWMRAFYNPAHPVCRARLQREFHQIPLDILEAKCSRKKRRV